MAVALAMAGVAYQGVAVAGHTLVARNSGTLARAAAHINGINVAFGCGSFMAPSVHAHFAPLGGEHRNSLASYWPVAAGVAAVAASILLSETLAAVRLGAGPRRSSPWPQHAGRPHSAATNGGGDGGRPPPLAPPSIREEARRIGRDGVPVIAATMGLVACLVGVETSMATWLYTYCQTAAPGMAATAAGATLSLFWASFTGGRIIATAAAARHPPLAILLCSLPASAAGAALMLAASSAAAADGAPEAKAAATAVGAALTGLGVSSGFANSISLLSRYIPISSLTQAIVQVSSCAGGLVFPPVVAVLAAWPALGLEARLPSPCRRGPQRGALGGCGGGAFLCRGLSRHGAGSAG